MSYFQRIYKTMDIPAWTIEQNLIDEIVGTVLKRRIAEEFDSSNYDMKNSNDSKEFETDVTDLSTIIEEKDEEKHDVASVTEVPNAKVDSTSVFTDMTSNASKKDGSNNVAESTTTANNPTNPTKKVSGGKNNQNRTRNANGGAKSAPKKGPNTGSKAPQTRSKNGKGGNGRGRGKGGGKSGNKNATKQS